MNITKGKEYFMSKGRTPPRGRRQPSKVCTLQLISAKCVIYNIRFYAILIIFWFQNHFIAQSFPSFAKAYFKAV